jgi:hypothetical protein
MTSIVQQDIIKKGCPQNARPHAVVGYQSNSTVALKADTLAFASSPIHFPFHPDLTKFFQMHRLTNFNSPKDNILDQKLEFYSKMSAKKQSGWPDTDGCSQYSSLANWTLCVWDTAGGKQDTRCYKCSHLYGFSCKEPEKLRSKGTFPVGQCAEALLTRRILKIEDKVENETKQTSGKGKDLMDSREQIVASEKVDLF